MSLPCRWLGGEPCPSKDDVLNLEGGTMNSTIRATLGVLLGSAAILLTVPGTASATVSRGPPARCRGRPAGSGRDLAATRTPRQRRLRELPVLSHRGGRRR